jgi:anaerobic dimethyl sulfoxide reductase subunit C (anchor subunit)
MACAVVAAVCAIVAQRGKGASRMLVVIAAVVTVAVSVLFRVLIYLVGFPVLLLY